MYGNVFHLVVKTHTSLWLDQPQRRRSPDDRPGDGGSISPHALV